MKFPMYDGKSNPIEWLYECEDFSKSNKLPEMYMYGCGRPPSHYKGESLWMVSQSQKNKESLKLRRILGRMQNHIWSTNEHEPTWGIGPFALRGKSERLL